MSCAYLFFVNLCRGSVHTQAVVNVFPLEVNYILDRRIAFKYLYIMFSPTTITSERSIRMTCRLVRVSVVDENYIYMYYYFDSFEVR